MTITKHDALTSLKPNTSWTWVGFDYSKLDWIDSSTKPTETEINNEFTRLTDLEPMTLLRQQRDFLLSECDWTQSRDITLSNDTAWKTYRQALRDLPASSTPKLNSFGFLDRSSVTWPTKPS